jgi:hypothetical protein
MFPPRQAEDDSLYFPTDVQPEQIFVAIGQLRKEARDEVDRLIRFLDKTDDYVSRELEDRRTTTRRKRLATSHRWASSTT